MIEAQTMRGPREDAPIADDNRQFACSDTLAALCERCESDPAEAWRALGEALLRLCVADAAGVVVSRSNRWGTAVGDQPMLDEETRAALTAQLAAEPRIIHWHSDHDGRFYAATAIVRRDHEPDGFVWARRASSFEWWQALPLRWIGRFSSLLLSFQQQLDQAELLLLESRHRSSNDLQLINGLLNFEIRQRADDLAAQEALARLSKRVLSLALARRATGMALSDMLRSFAAGLSAQVEDRGIAIDVASAISPDLPLSEQRRGLLMIAVNECVTNAVKHGFAEGDHGMIHVRLRDDGARLIVDIEDDGKPMALGSTPREGSGLDLVGRVLAGARGQLTLPPEGSKAFRIELPIR